MRLLAAGILSVICLGLVHGYEGKRPAEDRKLVVQLLQRAKKAMGANRHQEVIRHGRRVVRLGTQEQRLEGMRLIALSACKLRQRELARWAASVFFDWSDVRPAIDAACKGAALGAPPPPVTLRRGERACRSDGDCAAVALRASRCPVCSSGCVFANRRALRRLTRARNAACPSCCRSTAQCIDGTCIGRSEGMCHPPSGLVACAPTILGSLSSEHIQRVTHPALERLAGCLPASAPGQVDLKYVIAADGRVLHAKIAGGTLGAAQDRCLLSVVRTWRFPQCKGGGIVMVDQRLLSTR